MLARKKKAIEGQQSLGSYFSLLKMCMFCEGPCASIEEKDEYPQCCHCLPRHVKNEYCDTCNGRKKKRDYKEELLQATRKYDTSDANWLSKKLDMPMNMVLKGIKWLIKYGLIDKTNKKQNRKDLQLRSKIRTIKTNGPKSRPRQTKLY